MSATAKARPSGTPGARGGRPTVWSAARGPGRGHALVFKARNGDREVHGCDLLHVDDHGLIVDTCVIVRPLSAARGVGGDDARVEVAQRQPGLTA
jgi:hypothetical protein